MFSYFTYSYIYDKTSHMGDTDYFDKKLYACFSFRLLRKCSTLYLWCLTLTNLERKDEVFTLCCLSNYSVIKEAL